MNFIFKKIQQCKLYNSAIVYGRLKYYIFILWFRSGAGLSSHAVYNITHTCGIMSYIYYHYERLRRFGKSSLKPSSLQRIFLVIFAKAIYRKILQNLLRNQSLLEFLSIPFQISEFSPRCHMSSFSVFFKVC